MLPGNDCILICPYCEAPKKVISLLSGSTFGAVYWSDGYCYSPLLLRNAPVQQCEVCKRYYWLECTEAPMYAETSESEPSLLSSEQWLEALGQFKKEGTLTIQQERIIRLNILWNLNHIEIRTPNKELQIENSRELLHLMYPLREEDLLLCGELYRETGNFHACVRLLGRSHFPTARQRWIADRILEAAGQHETNVFKLQPL